MATSTWMATRIARYMKRADQSIESAPMGSQTTTSNKHNYSNDSYLPQYNLVVTIIFVIVIISGQQLAVLFNIVTCSAAELTPTKTSDWCFIKDPAIDLRRTCKYVKNTSQKSIKLTCLQEYIQQPAAADCSNLFVNTSLLIDRICVLTYELDKYKRLEDLLFEGIDFNGCNPANKLEVNIVLSNIVDMPSTSAATAASLFGTKDEPRLFVSEFNVSNSILSQAADDNSFNLYEILRFYGNKIQKSVHLRNLDSNGRDIVEDTFKFDQKDLEFRLEEAKLQTIARNAIRMNHPRSIVLQNVEVNKFVGGPVMSLSWPDCQHLTNQRQDGYHTNISISNTLTSDNIDTNLIEVTANKCQMKPRVNFQLDNNDNLYGILSKDIFGDLFLKHSKEIEIHFKFDPIYCCDDGNNWFMEMLSSSGAQANINLAHLNINCSDTAKTIQSYNDSQVYQEDCDKVSRWNSYLITAGFISAILILLIITTFVCMFFIIPKTRGTILSIKSHIPSSNTSESTDLGSSILEIKSEQPSAQKPIVAHKQKPIDTSNTSQTTIIPIVKLPAIKGKKPTSRITSRSSSPIHKRKSSSSDQSKDQGVYKKRKTTRHSRTTSKSSLGFKSSRPK